MSDSPRWRDVDVAERRHQTQAARDGRRARDARRRLEREAQETQFAYLAAIGSEVLALVAKVTAQQFAAAQQFATAQQPDEAATP